MNNTDSNNTDNKEIKKDYLTTGKVLKSSGKKFYKILSENMIMKEFQYHLGLNEDLNPFDPRPVCGGGLHFTDREHVLSFLGYGTMIAEVDIPDDETIVIMNNKYKAHRIILKKVKRISELTDKDLDCLLSDLQNKYKNDGLTEAANSNYLNIVKWLINHGADIHTNNDAALSIAACSGYLNVVQYLVEHGANIHACNDNAFKFSVCWGYLNIVKYLIAQGANIHVDNDEPLRIAIQCNNLYVVQYLIEHGANVQACDYETLKTIVKCDLLNMISCIINNGFDITPYINQIIITALLFKRTNTIQYLLEINDNKDIVKNKEFKKALNAFIYYVKDEDGIKILETLFVNKYYSPELVLRIAAKENLLKLVKFCIKHGANIHTYNEYPLKKAIENNNKKMEKFLIRHGANIKKLN